jgi:acyl-CoA synthetase (AMP-forming)/AMP-acid ligase II
MHLGEMLQQAVRRSPDKVAVWFEEKGWTYRQLGAQTDELAFGLATAGVKAGDRVALFMPNCPELVLAYFACFKLGAINVPLNYRSRQAEARYALEQSRASTLIVHESLVGEVEGLPLDALGVSRRYLTGQAERKGFTPFSRLSDHPGSLMQSAITEEQPAAILYTSGSTAKPKGVTYTHGTLWQNCLIQPETFSFTADDVHLVSTAACHAAAFTGQLLPGFHTGGTCPAC